MSSSLLIRFLTVALIVLSSKAGAGYNANFQGKITHVLTYTNSAQILIKVDGQPTSHPTCSTLDYLAIDADTPDSIRHQMLARILAAHASGEVVTIGYDKDGDCVGTRIRVYRVG
ncbi:hypothetical protein [Permianibacter aggregans]|uniref:Uncharacterized protein n=1 Tax=Permianibacter aggregans TaxID=1510150 RepID=A0A4R6UVS3_9GAMM|nr:hypothetical protein [Permianibacter aggregans]QGX41532.1 hypothetical protein E2H98_18405 [Permianibacter aggregans]TDQ51331.1 hypothetical protein EV696_101305 [Permianibacter aggregans]